MQFQELPVGALFTFLHFSGGIYRKVNEASCICVSYNNQALDAPHDLTQTVYPPTAVCPPMVQEERDYFQPNS